MADRIEIDVTENGVGTIKINGDPLKDAAEVIIHARAGYRTAVWIRMKSKIEGKVVAKNLASDDEGGIVSLLRKIGGHTGDIFNSK